MYYFSFLIFDLAVSLPSFTTITQNRGYAQFGTLGYPANLQHSDWTDPDTPKGGTLRLMASGSFDTLDPYTLRGTSSIGTGDSLQYDVNELNEPLMMGTGLYDPSDDGPASSYGLIAKSVEYAKNRDWMVFDPRPGMRFHGGRPITASDVVFSYHTLVKQGHPVYRAYLQETKWVDTLAPRRARLVLRRSGNSLLVLHLGEFPVLPQHYWKDRNLRATTFTVSLGSGPYRIAEVGPGRRLVFGRVKDWRDEKLPVSHGKYSFDRAVVDLYRDNNVAFKTLKAGEFGFYIEHQAKNWSSNYHLPVVLRGDVIRTEVPYQIPSRIRASFMNTHRAMSKERVLCQALGEMFDFEWTNHTLFNNSYLRLCGYYLNSEFTASGVPGGQEWLYLSPCRKQLLAQLFRQLFSLSTAGGCGVPRETLRHAFGLLADADWKLSGDRLLSKKDESLRFEILLVNPGLERIFQPYRENLVSTGIDARLRTVDRVQYKQRLDQLDYDMILMTLPQTLSPGLEQWQYFHSSQAKVKDSKNYTGIANPVIDAMFNCLPGTHGHDGQVIAACVLDRTLLWQHYSIPNQYLNSHHLAYRDCFALIITPPYTLGLHMWWQKDLETLR